VLEGFGEALGLAFQLSDDIMDVVATQDELGKEPGVDLKEGVYTLPVLHALHDGRQSAELRSLLSDGAPGTERLERALEIVRSPDTLAHARDAVSSEVARARGLAEQLPEASARRALLTLADYLAVRCGADAGRGDVR
jgi:heptaprenyl diphosphate synthase